MDRQFLVADIGGTHIRLALADENIALRHIKVWKCASFAQPKDALKAYLGELGDEDRAAPERICISVAAPIGSDVTSMTNHHWVLSISALANLFSMPVTLINDFSAQAWCLTRLQTSDVTWLQLPGQPAEAAVEPLSDVSQWLSGVRFVVGPGTGFGGSGITPGHEVLDAEPGHIAFAPLDGVQMDLLRQLWTRHPRVIVEHLLSGPGLANIYGALTVIRGIHAGAELTAEEVVAAARSDDAVASESTRLFTTILGAVCGDIALSVGATGGFFLSGAMLQKFGDLFDRALFLRAFNNKAKFRGWCESVPVGMLRASYPGLLGCAIYAAQLETRSPGQ